jgi:hypothetical protein
VEIENRITTVTNEYVAEVGRLLGLVRDNELWKKAEMPYGSWPEYLRVRWNWTPQYANLLIRLVPVVKALSPYSDRPINAGQGKAIWPVWMQEDGERKAVEVFKATPGKKSAAAIQRMAIAMGYLEGELEDEQDEGPAARPASAVWERFNTVLPVIEDHDGLRSLMREAPEMGLSFGFKLARAVEEIKADLTEEQRVLLERAVTEGKPPEDFRQ